MNFLRCIQDIMIFNDMKGVTILALIFLFLSGCKSIPICDYTSNDPNISHLCGVSVPINDMVYYMSDKKEIKVYRVWDENKPWTLYGRWWSLEEPKNKNEYREKNAICPEWSTLSNIACATIKNKSEFFIGTTKGVDCENVKYYDTSIIQIFIPHPKKSLRNIKTWKWE